MFFTIIDKHARLVNWRIRGFVFYVTNRLDNFQKYVFYRFQKVPKI